MAARSSRTRVFPSACRSPGDSGNRTGARPAPAPRPTSRRARARHWRLAAAAPAVRRGSRPAGSSPRPGPAAARQPPPVRRGARGSAPGSADSSRAGPFRWPRPGRSPPSATARAGPVPPKARDAPAIPREALAPAGHRAARSRAARPPSARRRRTAIPAHAFPRSSPTRDRPAPAACSGCRHPARLARAPPATPGGSVAAVPGRNVPVAGRCPGRRRPGASASASTGSVPAAAARPRAPSIRTTGGDGRHSRPPRRAASWSRDRDGKTAAGSASAPAHSPNRSATGQGARAFRADAAAARCGASSDRRSPARPGPGGGLRRGKAKDSWSAPVDEGDCESIAPPPPCQPGAPLRFAQCRRSGSSQKCRSPSWKISARLRPRSFSASSLILSSSRRSRANCNQRRQRRHNDGAAVEAGWMQRGSDCRNNPVDLSSSCPPFGIGTVSRQA